ncbi:SIS domain-containing protein [Candidatus Babeliales bacterium]|nr:SIS domain-containing protein [Candidatus Babeliales bacterium]MCF7899520.1 SIS domain-containing protein [Candidatus Babeliales bacterium]
MLKELNMWSKKLKDGLELANNFVYRNKAKLPTNIKKIAFIGMGGSGITGRIVKTILDKESKIPSFIIDSPGLPEYVDAATLAIVISYSGNTWETIDVLEKLAENFIPTIVIAHEGKAVLIAESKNLPFVLVPECIQPRAALGYFLGIVLGIFDLLNILPKGQDTVKKFCNLADLYVPKFEDKAFFSSFLDIVNDYEFFHIWGISGDSASCAYRAQTQFNENSKVQAVESCFPECCHNLLVGFTDCKIKPLVLFFYTDFLSTNLNIAIKSTCELLKEQGVLLYKLSVLGDTWKEQLFYMILWSDFASYYLGQKRGVQIVEVELINKLKEKHKQNGIK